LCRKKANGERAFQEILLAGAGKVNRYMTGDLMFEEDKDLYDAPFRDFNNGL
jgi:hypothetical protein